MNHSVIKYILGCVLKIEALFLLLPCLVAFIYREPVGIYYLGVAFAAALMGLFITRKKPESSIFYLKEGCVITALSWLLLSLVGCLPFWLSGEIPAFTDALFETISGFTTTGASILSDVEALSHCALFWRSFTHWLGGMGVLVFLLAVIPLTGGSHFNLMRAESPGPSVGKLVPNIKATTQILYCIYFGLTALEVILTLLGGAPLFDALTISFGSAGTGGFAIKNSSLAGYSTYIQWVTTIFMILFGVNFNAYFYLIFRKFKKALMMEEVRSYLMIIFASIGVITLNILHTCSSIGSALTRAAFQVASIITTTGYATTDFNSWPETSKTILILLMFVGACAGSTGGGIKVSRFVILIKTIFKELSSYLHPKQIKKIKIDGKALEHEIVRSTNVYVITFTIVFTASVFLISFEGKDLITNFTAVAATINNIGPGLELVGPTRNFGHFSMMTKYVLMFDMLAGRLELFPLLLLFHPGIWKEMIASSKKVSSKVKKI